VTVLLDLTGISRSETVGGRALRILERVDVQLSRGELLVLAGPSGSGKSTLVNVATGWVTPTEGSVTWHAPVDDPGAWRQVGIVPQRLGLLPELTAGGNVRWPVRLSRQEDGDEHASDLEARLGLEQLRARRCDEISFGEQQRVAIARALVLDPHVVIADEPTGHQDDASSAAVLGLLRAHCDRGGSALVATHDPRAFEVADRRQDLRRGS
jgi:putative ABC transport system ATP-binding protein